MPTSKVKIKITKSFILSLEVLPCTLKNVLHSYIQKWFVFKTWKIFSKFLEMSPEF